MASFIAAWALVIASPSSGPCPSSVFAETLNRLGTGARVEVQAAGSAIRAEVWDEGRVLWSGRIDGADCEVAAEILDIQVRRRLSPEQIQPVGALPVLPPSAEAPVTKPVPTLPWRTEFGAGVLWELGGGGAGRVGGQVDGGIARGAWGGRIEVGFMAPESADVVGAAGTLGRSQFSSLHILAFARGCRPLRSIRVCGQLGAGVEHAWARAEGARVFQGTPGALWLGRGDGVVAFGLGRRPGAELVLRGTVRSSRLRLVVEEAALDLGLPQWAAQLGLRGFFEIL